MVMPRATEAMSLALVTTGASSDTTCRTCPTSSCSESPCPERRAHLDGADGDEEDVGTLHDLQVVAAHGHVQVLNGTQSWGPISDGQCCPTLSWRPDSVGGSRLG